MKGDIYKLKLNEELYVHELLTIIKVPGGWIYKSINGENISTCFVPYNNVKGLLRSHAIKFAKWLHSLDNGSIHYNPFTKEESKSIGLSPYDCWVDDIYTVEELYEKWESKNK